MPGPIPPRKLEQAFHSQLSRRGLNLEAIDAPALFQELVVYYQTVRIEGCSESEGEDYLHFEASENSFYFERLLYVPWYLLYPEDAGGSDDFREKWGMTAGPDMESFQSAPVFPSVNLWSHDFSGVEAFAQAVLHHPAMQWARTAGPLKSSTFHEQVG